MVMKKIDDKIRRQYEVEKELASNLKNSSWEERKVLYKGLYDELFKKVPWHPRLVKKKDKKRRSLELQNQLQLLDKFISRDTVFLEVGPGDCNLALELTKMVKKVYAVDISDNLIRSEKELPNNFELIISDGRSIDAPHNSIDVAYSNQVVEHFHPEDVSWHIRNVKDVLKPGGIYIILTPHRFKGPCDVSKYFDEESSGLHLKEWTFSELIDIFELHKYAKSQVQCLVRGIRLVMPKAGIKSFEYYIGKLPYRPRKKIADFTFKGRYYIVAKK